jgi:2',3'-cyclic-nucleotide 2'-phosphodiesterase (5'-nucleotidase family)
VLLGFAVHPAAAKSGPVVVPILSTTDAVGELKPCGCHTPKGGLARVASLVDSTRIKYGEALVVEAGDFAPDVNRPHERPKIDFQFDVMALLGYDVVGVGDRELAYGLETLRALAAKSKLSLVASNVIEKATGKPAFATSKIVKKNGVRIGVFAVLNPKLDLNTAAAAAVTVGDPLAATQEMVAKLRKEVDVVVCLAHVGRVEGEDLAAQVPGIDVVILSHQPGIVAEGRHVNDAVTVASGQQIQNMGTTFVTVEGKKVVSTKSFNKVLLPEVGERSDIARLTKELEDGINEAQKKAQAGATGAAQGK